jgi:hypothetical protein
MKLFENYWFPGYEFVFIAVRNRCRHEHSEHLLLLHVTKVDPRTDTSFSPKKSHDIGCFPKKK